MFGWEFPPHIAGGLGTACEGIVKGLAYNGVETLFVMPSASGDEDQSATTIINASDVAVDTVSETVEEYLDKVKFIHIGTNMVPYADPEEFSRLVDEDRKRQVKDFSISYGQKYKFSGKYGANLMEEVARYAMVGGTIAMQRKPRHFLRPRQRRQHRHPRLRDRAEGHDDGRPRGDGLQPHPQHRHQPLRHRPRQGGHRP